MTATRRVRQAAGMGKWTREELQRAHDNFIATAQESASGWIIVITEAKLSASSLGWMNATLSASPGICSTHFLKASASASAGPVRFPS